ncbi:hypothetical protein B0T21DRAFT_251053, partial [Apiosordaria backusii]
MPATTLEITSPLDNEAPLIPSTTATPFTYRQPPIMQPLEWHYLPSGTNRGDSLIVAVWPTDTFYQGLQTMSLPTTNTTTSISPCRQPPLPQSLVTTTPLIHIPHCYLSVTSHHPDNHHHTQTPGLVERVGLPRSLVQGFLTSIRLPSSPGTIVGLDNHFDLGATTNHVAPHPHIDDGDDWVFSRCLLADFTGFSEEAAATLSRQGKLCCWISVVLDGSSGVWDLGFVVHRVGVCDERDGLGGLGA